MGVGNTKKNGELPSVILPAAIKKTCVALRTKASACTIKISVLSLQKKVKKQKGDVRTNF